MTISPNDKSIDAYSKAGVDIENGDALVERIKPFAKATSRAGAAVSLGGFGGLFDLKAAGFDDPILVSSNDGVGTKVKIAIDLGQHDTIGIDLVAMCVNDVVVQGAQPLFFLDYFACGKLDQDIATTVIAGIAAACKEANTALIGGETAEMPGLYAAGDYDLAGFTVGAAERGTLLPRNDIIPGDVVIAVASRGVHSNGFSLVRKIVSAVHLHYDDKAPFFTSQTLGDALLEPTRLYVKPALEAHASGIVKAYAHITGGGLPGNIPRVLPAHCSVSIDLDVIDIPPVFKWLAHTGNISESDMLKTFNCGVGFVAVCDALNADKIISIFEAAGDKAYLFGKIEERSFEQQSIRFHGRLAL